MDLLHNTLRIIIIFSMLNIIKIEAQQPVHHWSGPAVKGINEDPHQKSIGSRPYEMKDRTEVREPILTFDDCTQWQVRMEDRAEATLYRTKEQRVIGDYSGKVVYKINEERAGFRVELEKPYRFEKEWDCINFWNRGNHWSWINHNEALEHYAVIRDAGDREIIIPFMQEWLFQNMCYTYWFLNHIKLNDSIRRPITFIGMEFRGRHESVGKQNEIFLGPLYGYQEVLEPVEFKPFPEDLPFPLRKETILPTNKTTEFTNRVTKEGNSYLFFYDGKDARLAYRVDPAHPIGGVTLLYNGREKRIDKDADIIFENDEKVKWSIVKQSLLDDTLKISYKASGKKFTQHFDCSYTIRQKSLVWTIEEKSPVGRVDEIRLGKTGKITEGKVIEVPHLVYDQFADAVDYKYTRERPGLLYADDLFFLSMFDWYHSDASSLFGGKKGIEDGMAVYNGGAKYHPLNNGKRNPVRERLFINVSPDVHEVFPTIDNPASPMRSNQADRAWANNEGDDLPEVSKFVTGLRSKGVEKVSIRYHEQFWRATGESFTFKTEPNPNIGVRKLQDYVRFVQGMDWRIGFYTNYMDYAPVSAEWNEDWVRISRKDGGWGPAWTRCYSPKMPIAWEREAVIAPQIHKTFGTNFSYCDVETCMSPMGRVDYDSRAPGAGKFRSVFEYVGMLLLNERRAYQGPVYSEGGNHWFYAGLVDGNYTFPSKTHVFPDFHLLKIHPLEMDAVGGGSGYEYLAYSYAMGTIALLSEGADAIRRYAFLQPFQNSYSMIPVTEIAYHDGEKYVNASEAVKRDLINTPRLRVSFESGLQLYSNFENEVWTIRVKEQDYALPKFGILAVHPTSNLFSYSALNPRAEKETRLDRVYSDELYYVDTKGETVEGDLGGTGCYMLKKEKFGWEIIPVADVELFDFDLSLLGLSDFGVDIEAVDKDGNIISRITEEPVSDRVKFTYDPSHYKFKICPVEMKRSK